MKIGQLLALLPASLLPSCGAPAASARVVDAGGAPVAGVPVSVLARSASSSASFRYEAWRDASDAQGRVRLRLPREAEVPDDELDAEYVVRLGFPGSAIESRPFRLAAPPEEPVELRLPPTAPVEVRLVDELGETLALDGTVYLRNDEEWNDRELGATAPLTAGSARFSFVGLVPELHAVVYAPSRGVQWHGALAGPRRAGELAVLTVVAPERPWTSGRLVGTTGAPLRDSLPSNWRFWATAQGSREEAFGHFQPGSDGSFRIDLSKFEGGELIKLLVSNEGGAGPDGVAWSPAAFELTNGENALGDLVVHGIETIAGRCVDELDRPVGLAYVFALNLCGDLRFGDTDDEGRFELRHAFPDPVELRVDGWLVLEPASVHPGAEDVLVRVTRGGSVRAALAPGVDRLGLWFGVYAAAEDAPGPENYATWADFDIAGVATATGLAAGTYRCRLIRSADGRTEVLADVGGVEVVLGELTVDPRLQRLGE